MDYYPLACALECFSPLVSSYSVHHGKISKLNRIVFMHLLKPPLWFERRLSLLFFVDFPWPPPYHPLVAHKKRTSRLLFFLYMTRSPVPSPEMSKGTERGKAAWLP